MPKLIKQYWQRGQAIVMLALGISGLMFMSAIVFDFGSYMLQASRLQNTADSAALAGVAAYVDSADSRLISKPSSMEYDESFKEKVSGKEYTFDPKEEDGALDKGDAKANIYIKQNTDDKLTINDATTGLWEAPITVTLVDKTTASYTSIYCYRVDLKDKVPLSFAKFFGIDSWDIEVTSVAVAIPTADTEPEEENIDEFIRVVNANIYKTAPNLYWESIYNSSSSRTYNVTSTNEDTNETSTDVGEIYGAKNDRYFTTTINDYTSDSELTVAAGISDNTLAWKEGDDEFCADPITGTDLMGLKTLVYTINSTFVQGKTSTKKEATSIYIDRPNTQSGGLGTPYRACTINITGETLSGDEDTPLYMRVESEPILVNWQAMLVQPLTINIQGEQKKPIIVAYDGPDPNRDEDDTPAVDVNTGMVYKWSGGMWKETYRDTGMYDQFTYSFPKGASNLEVTSSTVSAPITVNLDHDFRGVIYAPFSKVIVYGSGTIDGFIMAAEIEDHGSSGTRKQHVTYSNLPTWYAEYDYTYDADKNNWFSYTVKRISANYNVIYDSFHNYTWTDLGSGV